MTDDGLHGEKEVFAGEDVAFGIVFYFGEGALQIVGFIHKAEVFPVELGASAHIEAEEVRVDGVAIFEFEWVFVAIGNIKARERVGNNNFRFGAHPFTAGSDVIL